MSTLPAKGTRWRHPRFRGTWVVVTAGRKYVTLSSSIPTLAPLRASADRWPLDLYGAEWTPA